MIKNAFPVAPSGPWRIEEIIMKMKTCLIALPLVWVTGAATADGMESAGAAAQMETAAAAERAPARHRMVRHRVKRLPGGDLRYCLDRPTNEAIIRCAETGRRR
jgi:hypothetical protein